MSRELFKFKGGIHPPEHKEESNARPIHAAPLPKKLVIPLRQHIGNPAKPVVQVGDPVLKGQMIAAASGTISDSTRQSSEKKYAQSGLDLVPMVSLMGRKLEVFGRFSTWERKEDDVRNDEKSLMRYGAGFNYHFLRRAGGSKPAVALQFAWVREQTRKEGADPTDTFMAQARFEWAHLFSAQ